MKSLLELLKVNEFCVQCDKGKKIKCESVLMCCYIYRSKKNQITTDELEEYLKASCPYWMEMMMKYLIEEEDE